MEVEEIGNHSGRTEPMTRNRPNEFAPSDFRNLCCIIGLIATYRTYCLPRLYSIDEDNHDIVTFVYRGTANISTCSDFDVHQSAYILPHLKIYI